MSATITELRAEFEARRNEVLAELEVVDNVLATLSDWRTPADSQPRVRQQRRKRAAGAAKVVAAAAAGSEERATPIGELPSEEARDTNGASGGNGSVAAPTPDAIRAVLKSAGEPIGAQAIRETTGGTPDSVRSILDGLRESGEVVREGEKRATKYSLAIAA